MAIRTNNDGLVIRSGPEEAQRARVSEYRTDGHDRVLEIELDYAQMPAVATGSEIIDYNATVPAGAVIKSVEIISNTDFDSSGDASTVNIGWTDQDLGATLTDVNSLVIAATETELNANAGTNVAGWIGTGQSGGVALAEAVYLTWEVDVEALTAGYGTVRVIWYMPDDFADGLGT